MHENSKWLNQIRDDRFYCLKLANLTFFAKLLLAYCSFHFSTIKSLKDL
jgi:hypothetical protein